MKRASLKLYKKTLNAGESQTLKLPGSLFAVKESDGVFQVSFDDADFNDVEVGVKFKEGADFDPFKQVIIRNQTAVPIKTEFFIGTGRDVIDARLNTLATRIINVSAGKNADTYTKATSGGAGVFGGLDGANKRKSISIFNNEAAGSGNDVVVMDAAAVAGHIVKPQTGYVVETSGHIALLAPGFDFKVMEVFYAP